MLSHVSNLAKGVRNLVQTLVAAVWWDIYALIFMVSCRCLVVNPTSMVYYAEMVLKPFLPANTFRQLETGILAKCDVLSTKLGMLHAVPTRNIYENPHGYFSICFYCVIMLCASNWRNNTAHVLTQIVTAVAEDTVHFLNIFYNTTH